MEEKDKGKALSPDTVLEDFLRSTASDTDSPKPSTSGSETYVDDPLPPSKWTTLFQLLRFKSKKQLATRHPLKLSRIFSSSMREEVTDGTNPLIDANLSYFKPQWKNFSYAELQAATSHFCQGLPCEKSVTFHS